MFSTLLSTAAFVATASAAFDPLSKNNVITYWGQGPNQERLIETCRNSAYDIINVGFVNVFPDQGKGGWPGTNFGNACWGDVYQNAKGVDTQLLKTCPDIEQDVIDCQQVYGKKIFLSIGGGYPSNYYLESIQSARKFANFLWAAYGPISASTPDVPRPWGNAGVDGFDFDIESYMDPAPAKPKNYQKSFYVDMIKRFKSGLFPTDTSKPYYISGAPQCGIPDAHFTDVIANAWFDFLFIQFYNTDGCSARDGMMAINGRGTTDISYLQWVAAKSLNKNIRMSIGLPGAKAASRLGKYWLNPTEAQKLVKKFYKQNLFGGVMLWEATYAVNNKICATDYGTWMKNILNGQAAGKDIKTTCSNKRDLSGYEEEPETTSSSCTSTVTLTRPKSSSVTTGAPSYSVPANWSIPASPATTSAPVYTASEGYDEPSSSAPAGSESAPFGLCTKITTLIYRSGSETSTVVQPCASTCTAKTSSSVPSDASAPTSSAVAPSSPVNYPSEAAPSTPVNFYPTLSEGSSPAASSPASPEEPSPVESYSASPDISSPASEACGEVTVTVKKQSTVYVTATATEGIPSEDATALTTIQSTSTIYNTHTAYLTRYPSESAPVPSSSGPMSPEMSSGSDYENSPVGGEGSHSSAPAAPAYPSHGHHHAQSHGHSHGPSSAVAGPQGDEEGPQSTTTVVNVVTVVPVPATSSGGAAQPTDAAPYPYLPTAGNGTAIGTASASASATGWGSYSGPQQTGGAGALSVSATLMTLAAVFAVLLL